jgi:hypothetical protein
MSNKTPYAPTLNGVPHLGRAEAVLYLILFYLFGHIHPRYRAYIDAVAQHDRLTHICSRAEELHTLFERNDAAYAGARSGPLWVETDLPDIYFALLYAWRLIRPRPWANMASPALSHQVFPAIQPD